MSEYRVPALRIRQGEERQLYSLAIEGKQISKIAAISRIRRGEENLVGYQRPEVRNHIREIQRYIESKNPMIPNPVIIAFDKRVRFEPLTDNGDMGHLVIPFSKIRILALGLLWMVNNVPLLCGMRKSTRL